MSKQPFSYLDIFTTSFTSRYLVIFKTSENDAKTTYIRRLSIDAEIMWDNMCILDILPLMSNSSNGIDIFIGLCKLQLENNLFQIWS